MGGGGYNWERDGCSGQDDPVVKERQVMIEGGSV